MSPLIVDFHLRGVTMNKKLQFLRIAIFAGSLGLALCSWALDKETVLYKFDFTSGPSRPITGLVRDAAGNLYGVTYYSSSVFEMSPASGGGWTYNTILTFSDCQQGEGPLVVDSAGNLYGASFSECGEGGQIYELSPSTSGTWTQTILYSQTEYYPSQVVLDGAGNLYGTAYSGGANDLGFVFELSPSSGGQWTLQDIYDFSGTTGYYPTGVNFDGQGNLLGTLENTGQTMNDLTCTSACGIVFKLTPSAGVWTESVLHEFSGTDGWNPESPLTVGPSGTIYGSTIYGGLYNLGTVFELKFASGQWEEHIVHDFKGSNKAGNLDGATPNGGLIFFGGGIYGMTLAGGGDQGCISGWNDNLGCGTAFELAPSSGIGWRETVLRDFNGLWEGAFPYGGLVLDSNGNLFGTTEAGGTYDNGGLVFELSPVN
jgi:uncharacterized repeat protein (TIGR03803 family)